MLHLLSLVTPLFLLVLIGYFARLTKLTSEASTKGLADFFLNFATPALLYKLIVYSVLPDNLPFTYIASYFLGAWIAWVFVAVMVLKVYNGSWGESVIAGLSTGQANLVMIGIPLLISVYGEEASAPIAFMMAINLPLTMTIATLLLEGGRVKGKGVLLIKQLLKGVFTHPVLIGIMIGYFSKFLGVKPFDALKQVIDYLAAAAVPAALISLGMALYDYGLKADKRMVSAVVFAKLLFHPFLTYILAHFIFQLPPIWVGSAVIFAAMPAGINVFLFAKRYGEGEEIASSTITITTLLSIFTIVGWLAILPK